MRFSFHGQTDQKTFEWFADGLRRTLEEKGHSFVEPASEASLVINFFPQGSPRWFRRNGQAVFVTGVTRIEGLSADAWSHHVFEYTVDAEHFNAADVEEIRPVLFIGDFDTSDLVFAFRTGHYEAGAEPLTAEIAAAVELIFAESDRDRAKAFVA